MTDLAQLLPLWHELRVSAMDYVLATVVEVEGSGYRKPGARMLIAADGRRVGTISGGCLEGEVARKAFWHTKNGPVVRRYSTAADDGEVPFGMGCGGVIHLLLERRATADPFLERLAASFAERTPIAIATVLEGERIGQRTYWSAGSIVESSSHGGQDVSLDSLVQQCFHEKRSFSISLREDDGQLATVRVEFCPARPGLFVFGAGDDALPLVHQASRLGWYVSVVDGRSHLATRARFQDAHDIHLILNGSFPELTIRPTDCAVVMTHSLDQDTGILREILSRQLAYIGVLGPRRRTAEILLTLANELELSVSRMEAQIDTWMDSIHAPMGLDLGGDTPADIALSVIAEIQQNRHRASGLSLRQLRSRQVAGRTTPRQLTSSSNES